MIATALPVADTFTAFGIHHVTTLLAILVLGAGLPLGINGLRSPRAATFARLFLGVALLAAELVNLVWYASQGVEWRHLLPLHLCDFAILAMAGALFSRNRFLYELAYYWGLGGSLPALLTPDLETGLSSVHYWLFFVPHGLVIAGICFATASLGLRPQPGSVLRVSLATFAAAAPAALINWLLGVNYMYLREKPEAATLFDYMGPWPWYVLLLVPLTFLSLSLWYSPFWISDRLRPKHRRNGDA